MQFGLSLLISCSVTKDGGATWTPQTSGAQVRLTSVSLAADGQRGWAVGENGTILQTRDGGATWARQTSGTQSWLSSVSLAADGQRGWVVGLDGTILQTKDGGATWTPQTSGIQARLNSVSLAACSVARYSRNFSRGNCDGSFGQNRGSHWF